jgi:membrane protease YdiL (CAAX protease family)
MRRPDQPMFWLIAVVAACYIILHLAIQPLGMAASHWAADVFVRHSMRGDQGAESIQLGLSMVLEAIRQAGPWAYAMAVLWMGVLEPIIEELFYRGLVLKALSGTLPVWIALFGQALVFAMMHLEKGRLIYLLAFGLMLGFPVRRTSSLLPAILLHVVVNVTSLVATLA